MNNENSMSPPLPLAGEGRSRSALHKSENTGCRKAAGEAEAEGGPLVSGPLASGMTLDGIPLTSFLSPWGEEARIYFLSNYKQGQSLFTGAEELGIKGEITDCGATL
jgi:hypothetical protein